MTLRKLLEKSNLGMILAVAIHKNENSKGRYIRFNHGEGLINVMGKNANVFYLNKIKDNRILNDMLDKEVKQYGLFGHEFAVLMK